MIWYKMDSAGFAGSPLSLIMENFKSIIKRKRNQWPTNPTNKQKLSRNDVTSSEYYFYTLAQKRTIKWTKEGNTHANIHVCICMHVRTTK